MVKKVKSPSKIKVKTSSQATRITKADLNIKKPKAVKEEKKPIGPMEIDIDDIIL